jgi:hypothetical protein
MMVEERLAQACLGCGERGRRGGRGVVRRGGAGAPFYRVGGGAGRTNREGNGGPAVGRHYWPSGLVGRGNGGGEWGAISEREGDAGAARALEAAVAAFGRLRPFEEGSRSGPTR